MSNWKCNHQSTLGSQLQNFKIWANFLKWVGLFKCIFNWFLCWEMKTSWWKTLKAVDTVIFNYREQLPPPSFKRLPTGNKRNTPNNIFSAKTFGCWTGRGTLLGGVLFWSISEFPILLFSLLQFNFRTIFVGSTLIIVTTNIAKPKCKISQLLQSIYNQ